MFKQFSYNSVSGTHLFCPFCMEWFIMNVTYKGTELFANINICHSLIIKSNKKHGPVGTVHPKCCAVVVVVVTITETFIRKRRKKQFRLQKGCSDCFDHFLRKQFAWKTNKICWIAFFVLQSKRFCARQFSNRFQSNFMLEIKSQNNWPICRSFCE